MTTERNMLRTMVARGASLAEIADAYGVTIRTVSRWKEKDELSRPWRKPLPDEEKERIRHLSEDEGWPTEEIAATLGIHYTTVREHVSPGVGREWSAVASVCSRKHHALWRELRVGLGAE